ncbi:MAG TPA: TIGR02530 family flagellar biosynthesis protein [Solirubrobacteraceae bacterium]|jgi:flagellar operon protein|nr:TIGR02530 family flagellar biosynthesis protein [Solirubrobacteraceae bacterium]
MSVALNPALLPPGGVAPAQPAGSPARSAGTRPARANGSVPAGPSFADVLEGATAPAGTSTAIPADANAAATSAAASAGSTASLRFSKHAIERAQRRGIPLDPTTLGRLQEGVGRIAGKGSRDSLVLVDGNAFVVSVPNRTVITAVGSAQMREHVFTNIDSAVIA